MDLSRTTALFTSWGMSIATALNILREERELGVFELLPLEDPASVTFEAEVHAFLKAIGGNGELRLYSHRHMMAMCDPTLMDACGDSFWESLNNHWEENEDVANMAESDRYRAFTACEFEMTGQATLRQDLRPSMEFASFGVAIAEGLSSRVSSAQLMGIRCEADGALRNLMERIVWFAASNNEEQLSELRLVLKLMRGMVPIGFNQDGVLMVMCDGIPPHWWGRESDC